MGYRECKFCGTPLDAGERCECRNGQMDSVFTEDYVQDARPFVGRLGGYVLRQNAQGGIDVCRR